MSKQLKYLPNSFTIKFFENEKNFNKTILQPSILLRQELLKQNKSEPKINIKNLNHEKENYSKLKKTKEEKINILMNNRKKITNSYLYYKNKYKNNPNYELKNIPQCILNKNSINYGGISFMPKYNYNNSQEKKSTIISQIKNEKIQEIKNNSIPKNQNTSKISEENNIPVIKEETPQNISIKEKEQAYPQNILIKKNSGNNSKRSEKKTNTQKKAIFNKNIPVENITKDIIKQITKSESNKNQLCNKIPISTINKNKTNTIISNKNNNCEKNFKRVIIINSDNDKQKNNFSNSVSKTQSNSFYETPKFKFILQNNYLTLEKNKLYSSDENDNVIYIDLRKKQIPKPINNSNYLKKYNKYFKQSNSLLSLKINDKINDTNSMIENKKANKNKDNKKHEQDIIKEKNIQEMKLFTFKEESKVNTLNEDNIEGKRKNDLNKLLLFANKFNV